MSTRRPAPAGQTTEQAVGPAVASDDIPMAITPPGDARYPNPAFYAYAQPAPPGFELATLAPAGA